MMMTSSFPVLLLCLLLVSPTVFGVKEPRRLRRGIQDGVIETDIKMEDRRLDEETAETRKKGGKGKGSKGGGTTTSQVSSAVEAPQPLYVSPNGAQIISITITKPSGSAPEKENGPVLAAQGAPGETPPGGIGSNGASATATVTSNSPPAPAPTNGAAATATSPPAPTPGPTPKPTVGTSTPGPTESTSTPIPTGNTTTPETTVNTTTTTPPASTASPAPGTAGPAPQGTTPPFVDNNIPKPHVPADACKNRNDDPQLVESLVASGFKPCTKTGNECNQAAGECCIEVFCMCGKPNGNIVANCVPDYDYNLLLETNK